MSIRAVHASSRSLLPTLHLQELVVTGSQDWIEPRSQDAFGWGPGISLSAEASVVWTSSPRKCLYLASLPDFIMNSRG